MLVNLQNTHLINLADAVANSTANATSNTTANTTDTTGLDRLGATGDALGLDTSNSFAGLMDALKAESLVNLSDSPIEAVVDDIKKVADSANSTKNATESTTKKDGDRLEAVGDASGLDTSKNFGGLLDALKNASSLMNLFASAPSANDTKNATMNATQNSTKEQQKDRLEAVGDAVGLDTSKNFGSLLDALDNAQLVNLDDSPAANDTKNATTNATSNSTTKE